MLLSFLSILRWTTPFDSDIVGIVTVGCLAPYIETHLTDVSNLLHSIVAVNANPTDLKW